MRSKFISRQRILFLAIIILAAFLRFYKLPDWFYFMIDEERDAFIIRRILVEKRPVLIGGSIPGGLYIGPAFYYISAIIMFFSKLNPIGEGVVASLLGTISVWLIYKVGKKLFSSSVGIFSSLFYSVSYLVVIYNRIYWPLVAAPIIALITYYSLIKIKQKHWKYIYVITAAAIIGAQSDPSNFSTLLLIIVFWVFHKVPINKQVKRGLALFAIAHIPLVLFDLRHNFLNTRAIINFFSFGKSTGEFNPLSLLTGIKIIPQTLARTISISGPLNLSQQINPCAQYLIARNNISLPTLFLAIFVLSFFVIKWLKNRKKYLGFQIIGSHLLIAILGVVAYNIFFPGYTNEWFFYVLFPAFSFIVGISLSALWGKSRFATIVAIVGFMIINLHAFANTNDDFGYKQKVQAIKFAISQVGDKPFYLDSLGTCHSYEGSRYLFGLLGKEPAASYVDPVFGDWLYPHPRLDRDDLSTKVVLVSPSKENSPSFTERYRKYLKLATQRRTFGNIEVLIISPSD